MKKNIGKRFLSAILSLLMVFGLVPIMSLTTEADETTQTTSYISMPITIRDFAADGMLFEFNQAGATGTTGVTETSTFSINGTNPTYNTWISGYNTGTGIYVCTYAGITSTGPWGAGYGHLMIICNSDGSIQEVAVANTSKGTYETTKAKMTSTDYVIWVGNAGSAYASLSAITSSNMSNYNLTYSGTTLTMKVSGTGKVYNQGDTAGFSLLATSAKDYINNLTDSSSISGTTLTQNGSWSLKTDPDSIDVTLNSGAVQQVYGAWIRTDLIQGKLDNGKMVYTEAAVDYLADYMQQIMAVPEQNSDGSYNTYFVTGVELDELDGETLAAKIRKQVTGGLGTYADAKEKYDAGNLNVYTGITTWYDAAYYLLHNTFNDSTGYGQTVSDYKNLRLVQTTNSKGETCYVFNSGYDDVVYDYENGEIYNTQTDTITGAYASGDTDPTYVRGNLLPAARFDPLGLSGAGKNLGYGMSGDTYGDMVSDSTSDWAEYYDTTNYNLSLEGHAQFIYYYDDNLYFTFTGDDDVYLFINGIRVLDVGAAHSISKVEISLNTVAEICGLEDGQAYDFDFYYMERHGTAANFGIETNIKIVAPAMLTKKIGYQNGVEVGYNGYIDPQQPVNYCFQLTNNGEAPLKSLTFEDKDIGVKITSSGLELNSETEITDLLLAVYNADGTVKQYVAKGALTAEVLKAALADGIAVGERILIHGFKYTIPADDWVATTTSTYFHNTVYTTGTAHYQNSATEVLNGIADYRVQKQEYSFTGAHFYTVGKLAKDDKVNLAEKSSITGGITEEEILAMIRAGKTAAGATVSATSYESLQICSASGNTESNLNTRADENDKIITYSTPVTGVDSFYFLATCGEVTYGPIQVVVYNYGYADNIYVLDYNLPVELNGTSFGLTVNDELLPANTYITSKELTCGKKVETYGTFALTTLESCYNDQSLKYTMSKFMSGVDSIEVTLDLRENADTEPNNRTNGVSFTEKVEVVPASVVYYEDDFAGITYVNSGTDAYGNVWAEYVGTKGKGQEQSADQDSNYGSDPNYTDDTKWGTLTLDEEKLKSDILTLYKYSGFEDYLNKAWSDIKGFLNISDDIATKMENIFNKYLKKLEGTASNGTIHELTLSPGTSNSEIMYFDFQGTGFELLSRATQDLYAVLSVRVYEWPAPEKGEITKVDGSIYYQRDGDFNGDGTYTYKSVPVITESEGGDAYEVPIIKIDDLPYSKYRVVLYASNVSTAAREIYVDGVRIYEPLGAQKDSNGQYLEDIYYSTDEAGAEFKEIRPLVLDETIAYLDLDNNDLTWASGTTVVEDIGNDNTNSIYEAASSGTDGYLKSGPNNEIYLDATATYNTENGNVSLLAFYVTRDADVAEEARTLQIGVHRKINTDAVKNADGSTEIENGAVYLIYGSTAEAIASGITNSNDETLNWMAIQSGTEQYVTIDPANLEFNAAGKALVLVGTNGGDNVAANILALTNLKISGYTLETGTGAEILDALNGTATSELITTGYSLRSLLAAPAIEDEIEDVNPDVSEPEDDLPGFSDSDEVEPDTNEPEINEPDTGEPETDESESDETVSDEVVSEETEADDSTQEHNQQVVDLSNVAAHLFRWVLTTLKTWLLSLR